ncbi:hypothetical protein ElyMa_003035300 [Elysia marginata]|uniref:Uncharacterized protein n=1 Tax=Elysia marginata TaxID=1093978 RepID=A0AAV4IJH1_9GAST|nr:hypothetical protein ElyMa_003035300 [Elysia marginata]
MASSAVASHNPFVSRASSTKYSMVSSSLESNSSITRSTNFSARGKLYRQITPRKKVDRFGVDKTDYKAFFLSSTMFPTAVRTTLLAEMQEVNPHKCGFDIVERRQPDSSETEDRENGRQIELHTNNTTTACTTRTHSAVNAPPPTAVMSMTDRSMQSAPVVAINILERSVGSQEDSHDKERRDSSTNSRDIAGAATGKGISAGKPKSSLKSSLSAKSQDIQNTRINENEAYDCPEEKQELEDKELDEKSRAQIENIKRRLEDEKEQRRMKPKSRVVPRLTAYSSADATRLIKYHWMSREDRQAIENETGGDIRDPLYLNTFFPDERPVRFKKTSLPTVRKSTPKARPWTVKEKSANTRAAAALKNSVTKPVKSAGTCKSTTFPVTGASRAAARSTGTIARRSVGGWRRGEEEVVAADDDSDYFDDDCVYESNDGFCGVIRRRRRRGPLLEVRPFLAGGVDSETEPILGDQRNKLRGKDGCLHSRVKQCVRFVRYRERQDKQGDDRPLKAEAGRYRPMSKTDFTDHRPPNPPPSPEQKMQRSVDAYRKYVDNIAMQTKYVASKSTPGKYQTPQPAAAFKTPFALTSSRLQTRSSNSNLASGGHPVAMLDSDNLVVRSVMDSNLPDMTDASGIVSTTPGRQIPSAIYAKDAVDVGQALAIRRISPKLSTNRIVAGTRGVVAQDQSAGLQTKEETPRWATVDSDDGEDMADTTPTNAIVVPQATKSECLSEYSTVADKEDRA